MNDRGFRWEASLAPERRGPQIRQTCCPPGTTGSFMTSSSEPTSRSPPASRSRSGGGPSSTVKFLLRTLAHPAASVVLYVALIDLAVETFLSDASFGGWVAGAAAVYLGLSLSVWRRLDWLTKSVLSWIVIFLFIAATVWGPGGFGQGITLLGQPTPVVLSLLSGLAILYSAALVISCDEAPRWARWGAAILGAYGLAAFVSAIASGTSYGSLFQGASLWSRLPFWMQGAVLGTATVVPAGIATLTWLAARRPAATSLRASLLAGVPLFATLSLAMASLTAPDIRMLGISTAADGSDPVSEVPAYAGSIFATWEVAGIDAETEVEGRWVHIGGGAPDGNDAGPVFGVTIHGDTSVTTTLSPPEEDWSPGRYGFELQVGARATRRVEFLIRSPETRVVLARALDEAGEPLDPGRSFPDSTGEIQAIVHSELLSGSMFEAVWTAVRTQDRPPDRRLDRDDFYLQPGAREVVSLEAPPGGFFPGEYRLDLQTGDGDDVSVSFRIEALYPVARLVEDSQPPAGLNVALGTLGGAIARVTSESSEREWEASNLVDGVPIRREMDGNECASCGWSTAGDSLPHEIVFSVAGDRSPRIASVILDPTTSGTIVRPGRIPRHVEVWVSRSSPIDGFERAGGARIRQVLGEQVIRFPPVRADYLMLRILSDYGADPTQLGEVKIIEAPGDQPSVLVDRQLNLARPALGGSVVTYSSQFDEGSGVHRLIDGRVDAPGWRSADGYLPQEFVFALGGSRARLEELVLRPAGDHDPSTRPRVVSIAVSTDGPLEGFEEATAVTLPRDRGEHRIEVDRAARFAKVRILETHGGDYTALGEIELRQNVGDGAGPGRSARDAAGRGSRSDEAVAGLAADAGESEPNDGPARADTLSLDETMEGAIEVPGREDYFRLAIPSADYSVLTLDLAGIPNVRTSVDLMTAAGATLQSFDPGDVSARSTAFSWPVSEGERLVRVSQPPTSVVLIWDASGSMEGKSEDLRRAVETYVSQVEPSERVSLIRFSADPDVLLSTFTSDREELQAATANQFRPFGGTALFDAVSEGLNLLRGRSGNKAIVVMTDGHDTSSRLAAPKFWNRLEAERVRLYTIGLGPWLRAYVPGLAASGDQLLAHIAQGTNGRFFFARNSEQLGAVYEEIARELRSPSTYLLRPGLAPGVGRVRVIATKERIPKEVTAPPQIELIFDASGSMREQDKLVDGRLKIDVAKDIVERIVTDLPEGVKIGLRVYGHRIPEGRTGDCEDSELVYPFGALDKARLIERVRRIRARAGTTPIAYSLRKVAEDFGDTAGEKIVVLVTDGKEECGGDVAEAASTLLDQGLEVRVNVVGFSLADESVKEDMEDLAQLTGGRFYDAQDSNALSGAIEEALAVPYDVLAADSTVVSRGLVGQEPADVPAGVYTILVHAAGSPIRIPRVRVEHEGSTTIELRKEGQELGILRRGSS